MTATYPSGTSPAPTGSRCSINQPAEFVISPERKALASSYSDVPIGRIEAVDVVKMIDISRKTG